MGGRQFIIAIVASFFAGLLVWFFQEKAREQEPIPPVTFRPVEKEEK